MSQEASSGSWEASSSGPLLVLCDWAEVINGKLYMMGAGWSRIKANMPVPLLSVAVMWKIPWALANEPQSIDVVLLTEDSQPVKGPDGNDFRLQGNVEVGRPPGLKFGSPLDAPLTFSIAGLTLSPGRYRFELRINGILSAYVVFDAV